MTDPQPEKLAMYRMCREEGRHEFEILAGRLNTFIMSQSFLVSAYAVAMGNQNQEWGVTFRAVFPVLLSLMGLVLSVRAVPGISSACTMIRHWHGRQDAILEKDPAIQDYYGLEPKQQTRIHGRDVWFAQTSPYIFGFAWIVFGMLTVVLSAGQRR